MIKKFKAIKYISISTIFLCLLSANIINVINAKNNIEDNKISSLTNEEFKNKCGLILTTDKNQANKKAIKINQDLPSYIDWRNVKGKNYITSVKTQGDCGCCYAFASLAALESRFLINNYPEYKNIDLSEQDLVSCCDIDCYGCSGGTLNGALEFIKNIGVVEEDCFPFSDSEDDCINKCQDWQEQVIKIDDYFKIQGDINSIKTALQTGPVISGLIVYEDLKQYSGGIYQHTSGLQICPHAVIIIGYNDNQENHNQPGYLICKNSWGTFWGEEGFFKVAYNDGCEIKENVYQINLTSRYLRNLRLIKSNIKTKYLFGEICQINWIYENISGNIELRYSTDNGISYPHLIDRVPVDQSTYNWAIPNIKCNQIKIQIKANDMGPLCDLHDELNESISIIPLFSRINMPFKKITAGQIAWGKYTDDCYDDVIITGYDGIDYHTRLYVNDFENKTFLKTNIPFPGFPKADIKWADFNNDSYDDLIITGLENKIPIIKVYSNIQGTGFIEVETSLTGLSNSSIENADFNNDGLMDLIISGNDGKKLVSKVYQNQGFYNFREIETDIIGLSNGEIICSDYNDDGKIDIAISGYNGNIDKNQKNFVKIYRNDNEFDFTDIKADLIGISESSMLWFDFDKDGDADLLTSGNEEFNPSPGKLNPIKRVINWIRDLLKRVILNLFNSLNLDQDFIELYKKESYSTSLYRNDNNQFKKLPIKLKGMINGDMVWDDFDGDGDFDLHLAGSNHAEGFFSVIKQINENEFEEIKVQSFQNNNCNYAWHDFDYDNDYDIAIIALSNEGEMITDLFENNNEIR